MKRALVTGITGQDGAYLARFLIEKGYHVVGGSRRSASLNLWRLREIGLVDDNDKMADNFALINLDVTCSAQVNNVILDGQFDEVYNLAAMSYVPESFVTPVATFNINAVGVLNLLAAIHTNSTHTRFYQAGTSEMFGLVNVEAQHEETPFHPRSPYGVAKVAAHYAVQNYREAYDLFACNGILFNHESPLRGEEFVTRKITKAVARIVAEKQDFIELGNIDAYRDWGHAADYVRAMWLMLQQDKPDDFVIATGMKCSVRSLLETAFYHVGIDDWKPYVQQNLALMRPSDVPVLLGDSRKARSLLKWEPSYRFEHMIQQMVDYDLEREGVDAVAFHSATQQGAI